MKLKPLEDRVIIKAVTGEEKTASGIVLPDTAKEKPMLGEVVAVGDGKWDEAGTKRIPMDVKVGDKVHLRQVLGHRVQDERRRRAPHPAGERDPRHSQIERRLRKRG